MVDPLYVRDVRSHPTHLFSLRRPSFTATWAQFFDSGKPFTPGRPRELVSDMVVVNAILFLAPISGFDQALAEVSSPFDTHGVSSHRLQSPRIGVLIDW